MALRTIPDAGRTARGGLAAAFRHWWHWLALAGLGALILLAPVRLQAGAPAERYFRLEASQWAYSPAVLSVNPGDRVTIELLATDVVHGIAIEGYQLETFSDPGAPARLTFVADQPGSFRFRCSVTCGSLHPFMTGRLRVGQNVLLWKGAALAVLALLAGTWGRRL